MVIDGKGVFLVSTESKYVKYFLCDGHVFLLKLVAQWEHLFSMYFDDFSAMCLIF